MHLGFFFIAQADWWVNNIQNKSSKKKNNPHLIIEVFFEVCLKIKEVIYIRTTKWNKNSFFKKSFDKHAKVHVSFTNLNVKKKIFNHST